MISYTKYQTLRKDLLCILYPKIKSKQIKVKNHQTKEKATVEAEKVLYLCLSFKISQGCVLTLAPPLIISPEELNLAMDKLEYALTQVFRHNI